MKPILATLGLVLLAVVALVGFTAPALAGHHCVSTNIEANMAGGNSVRFANTCGSTITILACKKGGSNHDCGQGAGHGVLREDVHVGYFKKKFDHK